jgi:cytochrome b561
VLLILGQVMTYRGNKLNIWDGLTNGLYSSHKLLGLTLLGVVIARLIYRLTHGAPADEPTLEPWQKLASHVTHWTLYGLLLVIPLLGWRGVSQYPALGIFGFNLPGIAAASQTGAAQSFFWHETLGKVMALLIVVHIGAAIFHHAVRKDGVLRRMLPNLRQKQK